MNNRMDVPAFKNWKLLFLTLASIKKLQVDVLDALYYYRAKANPFHIDILEEKVSALIQFSKTLPARMMLFKKVWRVPCTAHGSSLD